MGKLQQANEIKNREGYRSLLVSSKNWVANWIDESLKRQYMGIVRPLLPTKGGYPLLNGVRVYDDRLRYHYFDSRVRWNTGYRPDDPTYEDELVSFLTKEGRQGYRVVVVGGGYGVSTVTAANVVGESGEVIVYEAGERQAKIVEQTLANNDIPASVELRHAIVAEAIALRTESGTADVVHPSELPDCDILEMDAEGAELQILRELEIEPRVIIVETHADLGASEEEVRAELDRLEFRVIGRKPITPSRGIVVLCAVSDSRRD